MTSLGQDSEARRSGDCIDGCTGHPDLPEGWTSWQQALHQDLYGDGLGTWTTTEPVARAATMGHYVEPLDGDRGIGRWVCRRCDAVVIAYGTSIYGSAVERSCGAPS